MPSWPASGSGWRPPACGWATCRPTIGSCRQPGRWPRQRRPSPLGWTGMPPPAPSVGWSAPPRRQSRCRPRSLASWWALAACTTPRAAAHRAPARRSRVVPAGELPPATGDQAPPPDAFVNARPCSAYWGEQLATGLPKAYGQVQPYAPCGYLPSQLQGSYGVAALAAAGIDGSGVTVAITDAYASPTVLADANTYATRHGQPAFAPGQFNQVTPPVYRRGFADPAGDTCTERGWYGEETLDVEAVHALAPGANVLYVAGASCDDSDLVAALNT